MSDTPIDYYKLLEVDPSATHEQIRNAYKRAALKSHPDRVPASSPDRASRTRKFQQINDAYYTLSDARRRREYDRSRREANQPPPPPPPQHDNYADGTSSFSAEQFGSIFEEMLREEGMGSGAGDDGEAAAEGLATAAEEQQGGGGRFWSLLGGVSGAGLGFIVANVPGALAGAVAGNRLGAVRDRRGKSVYEAFQELPQEDRAKVLSRLAARVLQSAVS